MKPEIKIRDDMPTGRKRQICECNPLCKEYVIVTIHDAVSYMCKSGAESFAYEVLEQLGRIKKPVDRNSYGWTTEQEKILKEWVARGIKHGDYRLLGDLIGKTRGQVKSKVQHMRKEGKLT